VQAQSAATALCDAENRVLAGEINDCHEIAHWIGDEALILAGGLDGAFAACERGCIQGCYHGAMESYLASEQLPFEQFAQTVTTLCSDLSADALTYRQCIHGVGHGVMNYATLLDSIDVCLQGDAFFSNVCLGGVFMENVDRYLSLSEERLRQAIPTMCAELSPGLHREMCLEAIGEGMMFYTGHDLDAGLDLCTSLIESVDQQLCQTGGIAQYNANLIEQPACEP